MQNLSFLGSGYWIARVLNELSYFLAMLWKPSVQFLTAVHVAVGLSATQARGYTEE